MIVNINLQNVIIDLLCSLIYTDVCNFLYMVVCMCVCFLFKYVENEIDKNLKAASYNNINNNSSLIIKVFPILEL